MNRNKPLPELRKPGDDDERRAKTVIAEKAWMKKHAKPGLIVVVKIGYSVYTDYVLDEIVEVKPKAGRLYVSKGHIHKAMGDRDMRAYYFTGQSAGAPKGKVFVLNPVPENVRRAFDCKPAAAGRTDPDLFERVKHQTLELFGIDISDWRPAAPARPGPQN